MINNIEVSLQDSRNMRYCISWLSDGVFNVLNDIFRDEMYKILHKLLDAQIGYRKVDKQTVIKYVKRR